MEGTQQDQEVVFMATPIMQICQPDHTDAMQIQITLSDRAGCTEVCDWPLHWPITTVDFNENMRTKLSRFWFLLLLRFLRVTSCLETSEGDKWDAPLKFPLADI